jgi:hypothetical protein
VNSRSVRLAGWLKVKSPMATPPEKAAEMQARQGSRFVKGQSGNPAGRKPGSGPLQKLRKALTPHAEEFAEILLKKARDGDLHALRLALERIAPPPKAQTEPVQIEGFSKTSTLSESARLVIHAAAQGDISPTAASELIGAIGALARVVETDELAQRLQTLEEQFHAKR